MSGVPPANGPTSRRRLLLAAAAGLGTAAWGVGVGAESNGMKRPNIVYILADDMGYGDLGCLNAGSKVSTPQMDSLARDGMRFTDAHSNSAVCTPTRYGILTGRYAWRGELKKGVLYGYAPPLIEPGRLTVAGLLRQHGYATACVGKWHLGLGWRRKDEGRPAADDNVDFAQPLSGGAHTAGFEYSYIIPASLDIDPYVYIEDGKVTELPTERAQRSERPAFWRAGLMAPAFSHRDCLHELTRKAEGWIDGRVRRKDRPFFLYFPLTSPHTPHCPRQPFVGRSQAGPYGDLVAETDWTVGRIIKALKRNGLQRDTLLIVTSDNGANIRGNGFDFERQYGHRANHIYRGQKSDAWDGGHRIPFLARWPARIAAGSVCDQTICLTDLLATCASILGANLPDDAGEDSVDLTPLLTGTARNPLREATVHHSISGQFVIRRGRWKLICCPDSGGWSKVDPPLGADAPPMQLYDIAADPSETKNLFAEHPRIVAGLRKLLEQYQREGRSVPRRGPASHR